MPKYTNSILTFCFIGFATICYDYFNSNNKTVANRMAKHDIYQTTNKNQENAHNRLFKLAATINSAALNDTIYMDEEFLFLGDSLSEIDVIRYGEIKELVSKRDTLFANDYVTFLGDKNNQPEIFIKYNPKYSFEQFQITPYQGPIAQPRFETNVEAESFKTRINQESHLGPNFAGKLNIIQWGCGTNCQTGVILNSETGEIYDGFTTSWRYKSKVNSRLIITEYEYFEGLENEWLPFCGYCIPKFYLWDWKAKELIKLK